MKQTLLHQDLAKVVIGCFYTVYNTLGYGFLEKVYENALVIELRQKGLTVQQQFPIEVFYKGDTVGKYFADLLIEDKIILELKAAKIIAQSHLVQLQNYLKASQIELGFVFNFGPQPKFERRIFQNIMPQMIQTSGSRIEPKRSI
ncbi:MAG: GxxExxY protein [Chloroflexota bacterium]